jgi:hypothetical protein
MNEADRLAAVTDFISFEMERPYEKGVTDCGATVDRWVRRLAGFSPIAALGRELRNRADAEAWLSEPQGIAVSVNRVARAGGFKKTNEPIPGDVGLIISAANGGHICPAIHAGKFWFSRYERGAISVPVDQFWRAWRIE